jgi:hypothetical protein
MRTRFFSFILIIVFIADWSVASAQSCSQIGPNYFSCGVPTQEFEFMRAQSMNGGSQLQSNWCWAACVQMVLNYHGLQVSQQDVVRRIFGPGEPNNPAHEPQILAALSGWAPDARGGYSQIFAQGGFTPLEQIIEALAYKWPLIVGLRNPNGGVGHAYVMTGIYYTVQVNAWGNPVGYIPDRVILRDPWPGNLSRQEISWYEFQQRCMMAVKVWVSRN